MEKPKKGFLTPRALAILLAYLIFSLIMFAGEFLFCRLSLWEALVSRSLSSLADLFCLALFELVSIALLKWVKHEYWTRTIALLLCFYSVIAAKLWIFLERGSMSLLSVLIVGACILLLFLFASKESDKIMMWMQCTLLKLIKRNKPLLKILRY